MTEHILHVSLEHAVYDPGDPQPMGDLIESLKKQIRVSSDTLDLPEGAGIEFVIDATYIVIRSRPEPIVVKMIEEPSLAKHGKTDVKVTDEVGVT